MFFFKSLKSFVAAATSASSLPFFGIDLTTLFCFVSNSSMVISFFSVATMTVPPRSYFFVPSLSRSKLANTVSLNVSSSMPRNLAYRSRHLFCSAISIATLESFKQRASSASYECHLDISLKTVRTIFSSAKRMTAFKRKSLSFVLACFS